MPRPDTAQDQAAATNGAGPGSLRERIRQTAATLTLKEETVHVPEWETDLLLRQFTGREAMAIQNQRDRFKRQEKRDMPHHTVMAWTVVMAAHDPQDPDKRVFQAEDVEWIQRSPVSVLTTIVGKMAELNGASVDAEDLEKNSESPLDEDSDSN